MTETNLLGELVRNDIEALLDQDALRAVLERERTARAGILRALEGMEGGGPFGEGERAGAGTVGDVSRAKLLADPFHAKIRGGRPIACVCGCPDIGEHNARVSERLYGRRAG